ncbi:MAG: FAD-dependent oxidoreductase [Alphaproteobacteria bacterium]|nr:FAD-dependent oxidoreductase [Alphaproteobacteria bacterium]
MLQRTDVVIAGAGFAGLACAAALARRGLGVTVLERKREAGSGMHTTGILVKEAAALACPPPAATRRITEVRLYSPDMQCLRLVSPDYFFLATDTPALMREMSARTAALGVDIRYGEGFQGAGEEGAELCLERHGLRCKFLIGADGARSSVAEYFSLGRNRHYLVGAEAEFEGADDAARAFHCFISRRHAPGYLGWAVPGVGVTQAGLAVNNPHRPALRGFLDHIRDAAGLEGRRITGHRGGRIPAGGLVRPFARGNVILLGDAAGIVSPLTGGGIHTALHYGALLGEKIADHLLAGGAYPAARMARLYPRFHLKRAQRFIYERLARDGLVNAILQNPAFRLAAEQVFFRLQRLPPS